MITWLNRVVDLIENTLVTGLILTATLVAIAQVIARYVFNNSIYWSEEIILYAFITMSFLTMGMGVRYASHISVEAVYAFVPVRAVRPLQIGATCLGLIFAAVLVWYGAKLVINTSAYGPAFSGPTHPSWLYLRSHSGFRSLYGIAVPLGFTRTHSRANLHTASC